MADGRPDEPDDLEQPPFFFSDPAGGDEDRPETYGEPIRVEVEGVLAESSDAEDVERAFVLLSTGERKLPIVIGPCEAASIAYALSGQLHDRPLTHDLMKTIMDRTGLDIDRVVIDDLWRGVYYGKLVLKDSTGEELEVDCRPSDAIAMAVRTDAPVYVAEGILDRGQS
ncbi:MAG: bifunctional nuclease family protein [Fimbriimonadaceae bacterium]|nr:bifunctional nuclease family protein [Fimbriimonadaceae bacterium]